jgi:hypothetical protein
MKHRSSLTTVQEMMMFTTIKSKGALVAARLAAAMCLAGSVSPALATTGS